MCLGNAFDDRNAEADACVVGVNAIGAALKRLGKRGNYLCCDLLAGILDCKHHKSGENAGGDPRLIIRSGVRAMQNRLEETGFLWPLSPRRC